MVELGFNGRAAVAAVPSDSCTGQRVSGSLNDGANTVVQCIADDDVPSAIDVDAHRIEEAGLRRRSAIAAKTADAAASIGLDDAVRINAAHDAVERFGKQ